MKKLKEFLNTMYALGLIAISAYIIYVLIKSIGVVNGVGVFEL